MGGGDVFGEFNNLYNLISHLALPVLAGRKRRYGSAETGGELLVSLLREPADHARVGWDLSSRTACCWARQVRNAPSWAASCSPA